MSDLRYEPLVKIASGGMATVFLGAASGAHGFRQLVAIKRPHPHLTGDPSFRRTLLAEARLAARVHHANVVDVRDVESVGDSVQLVMDYVEGASLSELLAAANDAAPLPAAIAVRVVLDACAGLHAAHELEGDDGQPLGFVHRDVSPQNILVGVDGVARVTDFGIAKSRDASFPPTTQGVLKGKLGYMAPEYVRGGEVDRRADVFAIGVVLWEALANARLFRGDNDAETLDRVQHARVPPLGEIDPSLSALAPVVERALARDREARFPTADAMRVALDEAARRAGLVASQAEVGAYVKAAVGDELVRRRRSARERLEEPSRAPPSPAPMQERATRREGPARSEHPRERRKSTVLRAALLALFPLGIVAVVVLAWRAAATRDRSAVAPAPPSAPASTAAFDLAPPASAPPRPATPAGALPPASSSAPPPALPVHPRAAPSTPAVHRPPPNPYPP